MPKQRLLPAAILLSLTTSQVGAAGFALIEQSVSNMGTAYAGGSALADDASTVFFNPAGMSRLEGTQVVTGLHVVVPSAEFKDQGSTHAITGAPLGGGDGGDGGQLGIVPNFFYTNRIDDKTVFGLGVNAPFGLSTKYDKGWVGRYHAVESNVLTLNINPSVSYQASDKIALGVGFNAQYIEGTLSQAQDFGLAAAGLAGGAIPGFLPGTAAADGFTEFTGDSWGYGFNLGALIDLSDQTRLGVHYRSKVKHKLEATATTTVPNLAPVAAVSPALAAGLAGLGGKQDAQMHITLPETLSVSLVHEFNDEFAVMADSTWTGWSRLDELRVKLQNTPDSVTPMNWENSARYAVGGVYSPSGSPFTFRAGGAYEETPIPSAEYRTPRIPDAKRIWLTLGLGYQISDSLALDVGYAHLFVDDPEINKTGALPEDISRGLLKGTYDASVDIVSAQIRWDI